MIDMLIGCHQIDNKANATCANKGSCLSKTVNTASGKKNKL